MPEFGELAGTFGPVAALVMWMWLKDRERESQKEDPVAKLARELRGIHDLLIEIKAMLEARK